jgi:LCP family protein required for cell wall assembly
MTEKKSKILLILLIILLVIMCSAILVAALLLKGKMDMTSTSDVKIEVPKALHVASENGGKIVIYQGETYYLNEDITAVLCIGVDKDNMQEQEKIGYGGQADSLFLAVLNVKEQSMSIIGISRDSMVGVDVYDTAGNFVENKEMQLCLSYAYGNGKETSCENTMASVSRLLYGIPVHAYVAIDMNAIGELTDLVGGVKINPAKEDRKYFDFTLGKEGEVLINGVEAEVFVRYRDIASLESNNERIRRQKTFLIAFANTVLQKTKADLSIPVKLFQEISDEIVTSLSVSDISYLASKAVNCTISMDNLTVIQGEVKSDGTYAAFYPDETALFELILKTFYYKK